MTKNRKFANFLTTMVSGFVSGTDEAVGVTGAVFVIFDKTVTWILSRTAWLLSTGPAAAWPLISFGNPTVLIIFQLCGSKFSLPLQSCTALLNKGRLSPHFLKNIQQLITSLEIIFNYLIHISSRHRIIFVLLYVYVK